MLHFYQTNRQVLKLRNGNRSYSISFMMEAVQLLKILVLGLITKPNTSCCSLKLD